jgi:hypothetical protein
MIFLPSFRKLVLVGIVFASSFNACAEATMCSVIYLPVTSWRPLFSPPMPLVPMVANLPFTADILGSIVLPDGSEGGTVEQLYSIARDSDGRVSVKSAGYKTQGDGPMTFNVTICDPVSGTRTNFQACAENATYPASSSRCAVEKTARVSDAPHRSPDSGSPVFPDPSKPLPAHHASHFVPRSGELVDLGEKDMEGLRVHGYRNVDVAVQQNTCDGVPVSISKEWWLSEKTALEVSATTRRSAKAESVGSPSPLPANCLGGVTIKLTNIQQVEPDRELFRTPPDYKIITFDKRVKPTW